MRQTHTDRFTEYRESVFPINKQKEEVHTDAGQERVSTACRRERA